MEGGELSSNDPANSAQTVSKLQGEVEILPISICRIVQVSVDSNKCSPRKQNQKIEKFGQKDCDSPYISQHDVCEASQSRIRKKRRPYSPELIPSSTQKISGKSKLRKKDVSSDTKVEMDEPEEMKSFSCDRCHSPFIVNPARCHLATSQLKKQPSKRKKFDPVTNKILTLCNACGIALSRPPRLQKKVTSSVEDRDKYLAEAASFADALAERVQNPIAKRLYCPSFKNKPCGCIQTYLTHQGESKEDTLEDRVETLLQVLKTASHIRKKKSVSPSDNVSDASRSCENSVSVAERKQQQQDFEQFVLQTRQLLRDKLRLCERACQRILFYSNNFLHKKLKSEQGSRLSRQPGRNLGNQLKSIDELGLIPCCSDNCSRLARTHSTLLAEWRRQAAQGQRQARRVLAEMLTPSGGTKANCYKFISMVTGCGSSTISSVSHQMRVTKGDREPPEHGLRKWFRENPRKKTSSISPQPDQKDQPTASSNISNSVSLMNPSSDAKQQSFAPEQDARLELQQQRQELEEAKHQLLLKQQELDQIINQHLHQSLNCNNVNCGQTWKVNVLKTALKAKDGSSDATSDESDLNLIPTGDSVQLLDLIPGTYLAVPADFNSSTFLTVASTGPKDVHNSISDVHTNMSAEILHSVSTSSKQGAEPIASDFRVQTILNISSDTENVNTILSNVDAGSQLDIQYVTIPSSESSETCLPMEMSDVPSLSRLPADSHVSSSPCVSVITTTGEVEPLKLGSSGQASSFNSMLHTHSLDSFDKFF